MKFPNHPLVKKVLGRKKTIENIFLVFIIIGKKVLFYFLIQHHNNILFIRLFTFNINSTERDG